MTKAKQGVALNLDGSRILIAGAASLVGSHTADRLLEAGVKEVVLLDNFSEAAMREAVALNAAKGNQALLEVSGGVAIDQLRWIAATGVDRISIGRLTKDVKAVDYSMRVENPL